MAAYGCSGHNPATHKIINPPTKWQALRGAQFVFVFLFLFLFFNFLLYNSICKKMSDIL